MTNYFLLELQVEDLPARFLPSIRRQLQAKADAWLKLHDLAQAKAQAWATPRRIALAFENMPDRQPGRTQKMTGPKAAALLDESGGFLPQILGFAKSKGIDPSKLLLEDSPKGRYVVYEMIQPAVDIKQLVMTEIPPLFLTLNFPKTMRWPQAEIRFGRPIRGILALWNDKILSSLKVLPGLPASNKTVLQGKTMLIKNASAYRLTLTKEGLELEEPARRAGLISALRKKAAPPCTPSSLDFASLVAEASDLAERPDVLAGNFRPEYLALPAEMILAILAKSKIFGVASAQRPAPSTQHLQNRFLAVIEKPSRSSALKNIRQGYERLVESRLFDAKFFWDHDLKTPLSDASREQKLAGIVWSKELGSLKQKVARVIITIENIGGFADGLSNDEKRSLLAAAGYYKNDLATSLVGEYPDLAGKVAAYYAEKDPNIDCRESAPIMRDAFEDYPKTKLGRLLALADRADTLLAQFAAGNKPSAKEDPLGLKKLADSLIEILWQDEPGPSLALIQLIEVVSRAFEHSRPGGQPTSAAEELKAYFRTRLTVRLEARGFSGDRVEALMVNHDAQMLRIANIRALSEAFRIMEDQRKTDLDSLANSFKRAANILRQADKNGVQANGHVEPSLFSKEAESALSRAIELARTGIEGSLERKDFTSAFAALAGLGQPLAKFFEDVMVMDEDERVKKNRLALLGSLKELVLKLLDPSKLTLSS